MSVLPDVLEPGLRLVFCGSAASTASARAGAYYAGPGNAFWDVLHRVGLTPRRLAPAEFRLLPRYGIGLTDMAKGAAGTDDQIARTDYDPAAFRVKIERYRPGIVAFTGKRPAAAYYGQRVDYGRQPVGIGETVVFVLPSPSGAARRYWDESIWAALAACVKGKQP